MNTKTGRITNTVVNGVKVKVFSGENGYSNVYRSEGNVLIPLGAVIRQDGFPSVEDQLKKIVQSDLRVVFILDDANDIEATLHMEIQDENGNLIMDLTGDIPTDRYEDIKERINPNEVKWAE